MIECHIITAAMKMLGMNSVSDIPISEYVPDGENTWMLSREQREKLLGRLTSELMDLYVPTGYNGSCEELLADQSDMVHLYAKHILTFGSFYLEFRDAIKEGDGTRVLRCYRYLLPIFVSSGRKNYAIETLNMLLQHDYILSKRQAEELIWSRFINVHGYPGKNIPNDLHCEHLNRLCKTAIKSLGVNKTETCITRIGRALGTISPLLDNFDQDNCVGQRSTVHRAAASDKDRSIIIADLQKASVFSEIPRRAHPSFTKPRNILHVKNKADITSWIKDHIKF